MDPSSEKKDVVEKRVKNTVIRRRAKPEESAPKEPEKQTAPQPETVQKPILQGQAPQSATPSTTPTVVEPLKVPVLTAAEEEAKEARVRKGPKKKKSKAELELEDIQRAGGLKQYAKQTIGVPEWEPSVERVFEPGLTQGRRKRVLKKEFRKTTVTEIKTSKKVIKIEKSISVIELSQAMGVKANEIVKKLIGLGIMAGLNHTVDIDTATLIASEYGFEIVHTAFNEETVLQSSKEEATKNLKPRAPVVTIMGHVDHGKTSILDYIRKTKVTEKEAGGITQHIGAYEVFLPKGSITFIDTPGHAAFTQMRARGAQVTDIVVLVVAAEDGIMPQTMEAIDHAQAAKVPIIVAINKIDKPQADAEKVKRSLTEYKLVPEEWGGDVICVPTSAKSGAGIDQLLEMILLTAEVKEFKSNFEGPAKGVIIESRLEKGRGAVATCLVQSGTLKKGDYVVSGLSSGKVRAMIQADGSFVEEAYPSKPVEILGLDEVPQAGDELFVVESERDAKKIVESRLATKLSAKVVKSAKLTLEELQKQISAGEVHELNLVVKTDVTGSAEALVKSLTELSTPEVTVKVLHQGIGGITENDAILAIASKAVIIGFNVTAEGKARKLAENVGLEIRIHSIIYEVIDDIKKAMLGLLKPISVEKYLGRAKVKQVFKITKVGNIAGCIVEDGVIRRSARIRLSREGTIVHTGKISSLKRLKDDAREVVAGLECGISIENFNDIKDGDVLEGFIIEETARTL